ncbi:hypothetical protein [Streptomyces chryseus]|uniref:Uncharacterized protein n=1 Tax=Streptomyces chryseus TaxID=68186 RepID=A0ABQ3DE56_9ACTN|nr:hypothetical protein [Streptomyces chryseus]GHA83235.1 hypothetical protein GCM10010346_01960 [Streptomyces chryseus]
MSDRTNILVFPLTAPAPAPAPAPAAARPNDVCPLCEYWACRCNRPSFGPTPARPRPAAVAYPADPSADEALRRIRASR